MGEWHGLNEKLVQTLLTHFYSTHDLDDRESVQTYCEHLHLFFTVHWLNRNALTITWLASLTHFKLKKTSQTHINVSPIAPEQDIDFCILNYHRGPSQFSTHHCSWVTELFSGFNLGKCSSYACHVFLCMSSVPVAQWLSIALAEQKVMGSIPREHTYWQNLNIRLQPEY